MKQALFSYDHSVLELFPGTTGGVAHATSLQNGPATQDLLDEYQTEQHAAMERFGDTPLSEIPSIAAWRRVFSGFGVKPTQYRNAAESLLRRLTKKGDIPSINALVDIGNLISIRYALPVAFFDTAGISGSTVVRVARGDEAFTDLGSDIASKPEAGEVIFVDGAGVVSARRWCWRQSAQTATSVTTTDALVTVEGHHDEAGADVSAALDDLLGLLKKHQPQSQVASAMLTAHSPTFD